MLSHFRKDWLCVRIGDKYGFIDKKGSYTINPQFGGALWFSEGLARVEIDDKKGIH